MSAMRPAWLNVASHLDPKYGGICAMLPEFCRTVSRNGSMQTSLLGFCDPAERKFIVSDSELPVHVLPPGKVRWALDKNWRKRLLDEVAAVEGVHIHGLWEEHCFAAAREARSLGKPYVLAAHGMLERWAMRNKRLKKQIYSWLTERENVSRAACLHALTESEAEDYRRFGAKNPIAIVPNGVKVPSVLSSEPFLYEFPHLKEKRLVLFLGRIHHKKGLDLLVQAWQTVAPTFSDAHLVIAGPDWENTRREVEKRIAEAGLRPRVTFTGMLDGSMKWCALAACETFVLPSYSEGLSVSVLEAMGAGKPVIVTKYCNVPEVKAFDCGWVIDTDAGELASALSELLRLPAARAALIANNGRQLVAQRFAWDAIGEQMRSVYSWILGGSYPSNVYLA